MLLVKKRGLKVNQASAGKNIIGTASPGKSSGFLTESGSDIEMGIITVAKESTEIKI